jgi:hypothetical protein
MASATATRAVLAAGPAHHAPERRTRSVSLATPACSAAQGVRLRSSTAFSARTLASTPSHRRAEHRSVATRKRRAVTTFASADAAAVAPEGGSVRPPPDSFRPLICRLAPANPKPQRSLHSVRRMPIIHCRASPAPNPRAARPSTWLIPIR